LLVSRVKRFLASGPDLNRQEPSKGAYRAAMTITRGPPPLQADPSAQLSTLAGNG